MVSEIGKGCVAVGEDECWCGGREGERVYSLREVKQVGEERKPKQCLKRGASCAC